MKKSDFVFFWGGIYSQWYPADMIINDVKYSCCEQYMMQQKALLFEHQEQADLIMATDDPRHQKELGRGVHGFNKEKWEAVAREVVYQGNLAKFSQNPKLAAELLATGNKPIVEASPSDTIWGIGLHETHEDAVNPAKWRGSNWLGEAIMRVRETLRQENDTDNG